MKKIKVAVLYGGKSAEREISIRTGKQIIAHLDRNKYLVVPLLIPARGNDWIVQLLKSKPDVAFVALHGPFGEDGTIQGMLEMVGVPYTFSGVLACALAMDKSRLCEFVRGAGIKVPKGILITATADGVAHENARQSTQALARYSAQIRRHVGFPCVVKPNRLGSSVGITVNIQNELDLCAALQLAFRYDREVLVEEYIKGREITAAVLGNGSPRALPLIEIIANIGNFYNYQSKYAAGGSDHVIPAPISKALTKKIQILASLAHTLIGARGVTRSDFILRGATPYFLEINIIPGMTNTSLVPQAASVAGISFPALLDRLIALTME
ncbi:MAG: D-alanine--D-alanine ligase [bacterium]|nr:D-alanine--D-alanine ligase [bacterium]